LTGKSGKNGFKQQAAFGEYLAISRRLAGQDPRNPVGSGALASVGKGCIFRSE
jgi:hypothetical protein